MQETNDNNSHVNSKITNNVNNGKYKLKKKMKKDSSKIAIVIMVILIIISLSVLVIYLVSQNTKNLEQDSKGTNVSNKETTKTLMIYMCGSDLESKNKLGTMNLKDLMESDIDYDNINIVLCAGGTEKWHISDISNSETSIYTIDEEGITKVKKQKKLDMGDGYTVTNFLDYVYENYDTDEYYLMFWNHGSALQGIELDELSENIISLPDLDECLQNSEFSKNNIKFDLIILNNCLMGSLETASILSDYGNYLVASEDVMYGDKQIKTFKFLDGVTAKDHAIEVGKSYIDCYINSVEKFLSGVPVTSSLIDLSKIDDVIDELDNYIVDIELNEKSFKKMAKIRSRKVYEYQKNSDYMDMVDLYELISELEPINDENERLLDSIEKAVVYNCSTDTHSNGISIYFPESYDWMSVYDELDFSQKYQDFVEDYLSMYNGKKTISFSMDNKEVQKSSYGFSWQLTEDEASIYKKSHFLLFEKNEDGTYTMVLRSPYSDIDESGLITADLKRETIALIDETDPMLELGYLKELDRTDEYTTYLLPIVLEYADSEDDKNEYRLMNDTVTAMVILKAQNDGSAVDIVNYLEWSTDENGVANTNGALLDIYNGDYKKIYFLKSNREITLDENGNYKGIGDLKSTYGIELYLNEKFSFKQVELDPEKKYVGVLCVEDIYGDVYYSKLIDVEL